MEISSDGHCKFDVFTHGTHKWQLNCNTECKSQLLRLEMIYG